MGVRVGRRVPAEALVVGRHGRGRRQTADELVAGRRGRRALDLQMGDYVRLEGAPTSR